MGYVQQVSVQVGDHVREGQALITLDARDLDASLHRAEAGRAEIESADSRTGERHRRRKSQSGSGAVHLQAHAGTGGEEIDFQSGDG